MADQLRGGSTAGGFEIVTQKEVPMIFRVDSGKLQYSTNNGITWLDAEFTGDATATAAQMLSGVTAYVNGNKVTGTITSKGAATITPGTSNQTISAGQYLSGAQTIASLGGTATAPYVLAGYSFSSDAAGRAATGTMANRGTATIAPSTANQTLPAGYYSSVVLYGDPDFTAANIKSGVNIFGVVGSLVPQNITRVTNTLVGDVMGSWSVSLGWRPDLVMARAYNRDSSYWHEWVIAGRDTDGTAYRGIGDFNNIIVTLNDTGFSATEGTYEKNQLNYIAIKFR